MGEEIKILGAGIAGLTASINLAKKGFDVIVYEKASSVGSRFHNDFQGLENWCDEKDVLEILAGLSIKTDFWNKGFNEVSIYTDLHREFVARDKSNFFYLVERGPKNSLDECLKNQALDAGVRIKFNSTVHGDDCDIIATGVSGRKPLILAKGVIFDTDAEDSIILILNDKLAIKGYTYLLIAGGRATLASVVFKDFSKANFYFKNSFEAIKGLMRLKIENKKFFGGYGTFAVNKSNTLGQKLVAGEAGGFQDFLLGFGMKYAFLSGHLAAKSLIDAKNYDSLWKELLLKRLKASASNRLIYELAGQRGYNYLVNQALSSKSPRLWLKDFYSYSSSKRLAFPFTNAMLKIGGRAGSKDVRF